MIKLLRLHILLALLMGVGVTGFSCLPEKPKPPRQQPIKNRRENRQNDRAVPVPPPAKQHIPDPPRKK